MLDCQMFGPNAGAHHFMNVLWHALNVALLFLWLTQLTGRMGPAAFIAALFAWHPLHVESVAWISERKDVLSTFFGLLTLMAYTRYAQAHDRRFLWLALGCFVLGIAGQADAGDAAVCVAIAGLLAAAAIVSIESGSVAGKAAVLWADGGFVRGDFSGAATAVRRWRRSQMRSRYNFGWRTHRWR